jgi:hypothetical protein
MIDCKNLVHPFQNDPGTSQSQRLVDELLSSAPKIDGRTLADLLNFFVKIAPHINFYDTDLHITDWQPFFQQGFPFLLASICNYNVENVNGKFNFYTSIFKKKPTYAGLQLSVSYVFYNIIKKVNDWFSQVSDSELPIVTTLEQSIKNKLQQPLRQFIAIANASRQSYCTKAIDFTDLYNNDLWSLDLPDLYSIDDSFMSAGKSKRKRMIALQNEIVAIVPAFTEAIKAITAQAQQDLPQSFIPVNQDWQQKNAPHLALLFCFINIFQQQLGDLNCFTRKHLDFFYKNVLLIRPQAAIPDHANIVFQLQNQVKQYLLSKNLLVKDGKDSNSADIEFSLDDDIVVNETQVTDIRTLFVNNETANEKTYVEGVYIAPNATKANGVDQDFAANQPTNYPTLGNKYSKYIPATKTSVQQYPGARLGFILASYILFLDKAERTIEIILDCELLEDCVGAKKTISKKNTSASAADEEIFPSFIPSKDLYEEIERLLTVTYIYINEDIIQQAIKKGLSEATAKKIREHLKDDCKKSLCGDDKIYYKEETTFELTSWAGLYDKKETDVLNEIFPLRRALTLSFSGDKDWIVPAIENIVSIQLTTTDKNETKCTLNITVNLTADQEAVTFYNKANLKEDFGTSQPLVKIELDDSLKISLEKILSENKSLQNTGSNCCLDCKPVLKCREVSLYHFFRNLVIANATINVTVCGLKNFIVQNDLVVQDVNSPIYPFGAIPKVDANFYIGSEEILLKKWEKIYINLNWKSFPTAPSDSKLAPFEYHYDGYKNYYLRKKESKKSVGDPGKTNFEIVGRRIIEDDRFRIDLAILQDGKWNYWLHCRTDTGEYNCGSEKYFDTPGKLDKKEEMHCQLFQSYKQSFCDKENFSNQYRIHRKEDFKATLDLPKEAMNFLGYKQYEKTNIHGFIKITLKCQDFQHDIYPFVLAEYLIDLAWQNQNLHQNQNSGQINQILVRPKEPWTPIISNMSIDYTATAGPDDIDLIHLYPYDGTYKEVEIKLHPTLFPAFCEEGTLFLGLQNLIPGSNVNILFQLAEATSDSESDPQTVYWQYLANNKWVNLRPGFEILTDATENLTRSGIIEFSLPDNISSDNTVMPNTLYWIKAAVPQNSTAASETIGIYAQAMSATFTNNTANDRLRLSTPLAAGSVSSLSVADANIKQVNQPGPSFGGQAQEDTGPAYYLRVSELLRHKGRAIQKFDYERLALQQFPQLFKVKCINHSFALNANDYINDFPIAPGYVLLAVIPNLNLLEAGNSFEPKVPVSMLEDIETAMYSRTSPFVRFRAMNPRYEGINFCIRVQLMPDRDPTYFANKLQEDLREFLAPWAVGKYDKLTFGECVNRSDIINFIETLEYVDYIVKLDMFHESDVPPAKSLQEICPATPRSILIAGDIDVTIQLIECEKWSKTGACRNKKTLLNNYCKKNEKTLIK